MEPSRSSTCVLSDEGCCVRNAVDEPVETAHAHGLEQGHRYFVEPVHRRVGQPFLEERRHVDDGVRDRDDGERARHAVDLRVEDVRQQHGELAAEQVGCSPRRDDVGAARCFKEHVTVEVLCEDVRRIGGRGFDADVERSVDQLVEGCERTPAELYAARAARCLVRTMSELDLASATARARVQYAGCRSMCSRSAGSDALEGPPPPLPIVGRVAAAL
jgi:hypothetical protein